MLYSIRCFAVDPEAVQQVADGLRTDADASWWGFDKADSTAFLQYAINSKATKITVPNMGYPWVVETIFLESGKEIILEPGVVVEAKRGAFLSTTAVLFDCSDKTGIRITGYGAKIMMHRQDYIIDPYTAGEWRHAVSIRGCSGVDILGVEVANSGGDGIYIGRSTLEGGLPRSENIMIKEVRCYKHHRQGISITSAANLLIENSIFQSTEGTPPQDGIDFEPNRNDDVLINCIVRGCTIMDNRGNGVEMYLSRVDATSQPVSILIDSCKFLRNWNRAILVRGKDFTNGGTPTGDILIRSCMMDGVIQLNKTDELNIDID